jgi:hypothetical protein
LSASDLPTPYQALRDVLSDVNGWLHYAEAKNAALIGANFAISVALVAAVTAMEGGDPVWLGSIAATAGTLLLGGIVSLTSFFAKLSPPASPASSSSWTGNTLYFGDLVKIDPESYLGVMRSSLGATGDASQIEKDLAGQIIVNSRIASPKFLRFNTALRITICGLTIPPVAGIICQIPFIHALLP